MADCTGRAELLLPHVRRRRTRFPVAKSLSVTFVPRRKEISKESGLYRLKCYMSIELAYFWRLSVEVCP